MNKLVDLLNEYDSNWGFTDYWALFNRMNEWISGTEDLQVISKKFWFIQRLVVNDKIDFDNRDLKDEFMLEFERYPVFQGNTYNWDFNENGILMLLSIQDNPISFLISILKKWK